MGLRRKLSSSFNTYKCKLDRHLPCIIKMAQMSVASGTVGDIHCGGSWEVTMMKLLTLSSESGSWHYKRCSLIVELLNIASFCLSDRHASPLMQVCLYVHGKTHGRSPTWSFCVTFLSMSAHVLPNQHRVK